MTLHVETRHTWPGFNLDVQFTVAAGGVTALFGASGAGKSSILKSISGLLKTDRAEITLNGTTLTSTDQRVMLPAHRRGIGLMFQDSRLFPHMTVRSNLVYGAKRVGNTDANSLTNISGLLGIEGLLDRKPSGLSGGEAQRVALGRTLLTKPQALLLDEPLASLDQARKDEILPYLQRVASEADIPILYVSHSIEEVARLADHMVVLNKGKVAGDGPVTDVLSRLDLFPLTGRFEAGALIQGEIAEHDSAAHLSAVSFPGGRLWVAAIDGPVGSPVRVRVRARDVMLATNLSADQADHLSANSRLDGVVSGLRADHSGPFVEVQVTCSGGSSDGSSGGGDALGSTRVLARITHRSAQRLGIAVGKPVTAILKSATVERRLKGLTPKS